jgi:hypothetical protein
MPGVLMRSFTLFNGMAIEAMSLTAYLKFPFSSRVTDSMMGIFPFTNNEIVLSDEEFLISSRFRPGFICACG